MPFYQKQGRIPAKRHSTFYQDDGKSLYREELFSTQGFSHIYSNRYRIDMPTKVLSIAEPEPLPSSQPLNKPLQWLLFHTSRHKRQGNFISGSQFYLKNTDCHIGVLSPSENDVQFYKYAHQHALFFIHGGSGTLHTEFGDLQFNAGDYLILPKGIIFQWAWDDPKSIQILMVLSSRSIDIPHSYRNSFGQLSEEAPYCERDLRPPVLAHPISKKGEYPIHILTSDHYVIHVWEHHPFDVVGWDGCEYPFAFNIKDFSPKVGAIHLPPPVHMVFQTPHFVVCNFVPRLFDFHPDAIPAPYFHSNVDSDEVIYYVEGNFMSRRGIEAGSISYHPMGIAHGPQPGKTEASIGKKSTQEYAVMIDTFAPLSPQKNIEAHRVPDYWKSWLTD